MDLLKSLNKATSGGNDSENHAQGHHQQKQQSSNSELLSSAKLMAEAAKSSYGGESDKVDKAKVAAAGADLLDAASKYGKLEEKSFGKYVEKAEEYLHNYHNTHSSTTTGGGVPGHGHSDSAPQTGHTTHSAPSHEGGGGGGHPDSGDGDSGNKYGEYFKAAEGFLPDYDTTNTTPVLKTPSPMEKQAASLYTRRIFKKFQEELVETLANPATKVDDSGTVATYRVAKFGEDHKAHAVSFNSFEMKATCSCQMFEHLGIICRHILAVFRAKNVLTLPSQYVLKRWTRNARTGAVLDERASELPNNSRESLTVRYNNLRQEAIKYVEEGAKSIHIYNVAMDALQEAAKKVAAVKSQGSGATQGGNLSNGGSQELHATEENQMSAYPSVDEKEKKIHELTAELENTNQRCEVYRANLLAVLRDMEDQKLKLSVKVQNARLSLKE